MKHNGVATIYILAAKNIRLLRRVIDRAARMLRRIGELMIHLIQKRLLSGL